VGGVCAYLGLRLHGCKQPAARACAPARLLLPADALAAPVLSRLTHPAYLHCLPDPTLSPTRSRRYYLSVKGPDGAPRPSSHERNVERLIAAFKRAMAAALQGGGRGGGTRAAPPPPRGYSGSVGYHPSVHA